MKENAVAERVNGIKKDEYLDNCQVKLGISEAKELLESVFNRYNNERPHTSISNFTPNEIQQMNNSIKTERLWKNYYKKQPVIVNQEQD